MLRIALWVLVAAGLALPSASAASSATLVYEKTTSWHDRYTGTYSTDHYSLTVDGPGPESNELSLTSGQELTIHDAASAIAPGPGCEGFDAHTVVCRFRPTDANYRDTSVRILTGDGADSVDLREYPPYFANIEVDLGAGDDNLLGSATGLHVDGGPGADELHGSSSFDSLDYSNRTGPVAVTYNGLADDGEPGEGDRVDADFDRIETGSGDDLVDLNGFAAGRARYPEVVTAGGDDTVIGSYHHDNLFGGDGDDTLTGGGGTDLLIGGAGADALAGGTSDTDGRKDIDRAVYTDAPAGVRVTLDGIADDGTAGEGDNVAGDIEAIDGSPFGDFLVGNDEPNEILGAGGSDKLFGQGGDDHIGGGPDGGFIHAGAGRDFVGASAGPHELTTYEIRDGEVDRLYSCGPWRVTADAFDELELCPAQRGKPPLQDDIEVETERAIVGKSGRGRFRVWLSSTYIRATGTFALRRAGKRIGGGDFTARSRELVVNRFRLSRAGRRALGNNRRLGVVVDFNATDARDIHFEGFDRLTLVRRG